MGGGGHFTFIHKLRRTLKKTGSVKRNCKNMIVRMPKSFIAKSVHNTAMADEKDTLGVFMN